MVLCDHEPSNYLKYFANLDCLGSRGASLTAPISLTRRLGKLAEESIVLGMSPNPEPEQTVFDFDGKSTVGKPDANGSILSDLLKMQGWMLRIGLEKLEVLVR
jgi:hypothetical protein